MTDRMDETSTPYLVGIQLNTAIDALTRVRMLLLNGDDASKEYRLSRMTIVEAALSVLETRHKYHA